MWIKNKQHQNSLSSVTQNHHNSHESFIHYHSNLQARTRRRSKSTSERNPQPQPHKSKIMKSSYHHTYDYGCRQTLQVPTLNFQNRLRNDQYMSPLFICSPTIKKYRSKSLVPGSCNISQNSH